MRRSAGEILLLMLVAQGCSSPDRPAPIDVHYQARPDVPERVPEKSSAYEPRGCFTPPPAGYAVDCGVVTVPESPTSELEVELAVMVLYTTEAAPAEPVVYLEGGPGASAIATTLVDPFPFEHILEHQDLILIDQRGTGFSEPFMGCEETLDASVDEALAELLECRNGLVERGIDLGQYNTRQNANDIDRVREALGYDGWHLYGISYGTRLALTVARDFPGHVRSMIIDGVLPLQADLLATGTPSLAGSLEAIDRGCQAQADCAEAYGELRAKLFDLVDRLEADPVELDLGGGLSFMLSGRLAFSLLFQLLYVGEFIPYFPAVVAALDAGNYQIFEMLATSEAIGPAFASGMYYSVTCQDEAAFTSREIIESARADFDEHYQLAYDANDLLAACEIWDVPAAPASENEVALSDVPALVTSGAFDPVTPPAFGTLAASGLANALELVLPDASHGASLSECGRQLVSAFLTSPEGAGSVPCVAELQDPEFLVDKALPGPEPRVRFAIHPRWDAALVQKLHEAFERSRLIGAPRASAQALAGARL